MIKKLIIYYSFILTATMTLMGFLNTQNVAQLISAIVFFPLTAFFALQVLPRPKSALKIPTRLHKSPSTRKTRLPTSIPTLPKPSSTNLVFPQLHYSSNSSIHSVVQSIPSPLSSQTIEEPIGIDQDRRKFIKLIGSAGLSVFVMSLFTKKAQAAFFGSVPGPGTVALKDPETGQQISPAIRTPTDGYKISQIDDSTPAYYGFVNKEGEWFIMREDTSGNYRYTKGATNFNTNWTNRASLSYDYFDIIF